MEKSKPLAPFPASGKGEFEERNKMRGRPKKELQIEEVGTRHTVQSVERTFDILEALADFKRPVPLSELSLRVGLNVSTVHRLLATLIERGYAQQELATGHYGIGKRLLSLGSGMDGNNDLQLIAHPVLQKLAGEAGETANLSVRSGDQLVYIDQVQADRMMRMFTKVGSNVPLYSTGSGKLFLAYATDPIYFDRELNRYLLENELKPRTTATIIEARVLREELLKIRERGYSFDNEEMEEGVICVAAPIFDRSKQIIAGISVSGPTSRLGGNGHGTISQAIQVVKAAAQEITSKMEG